MKIRSSCKQWHFGPPSRAIQRQGFQLRQRGLAVTEEATLRVVRASLHKGQQGASHNALGWQTQHVAEVPQSALSHSQYQVFLFKCWPHYLAYLQSAQTYNNEY